MILIEALAYLIVTLQDIPSVEPPQHLKYSYPKLEIKNNFRHEFDQAKKDLDQLKTKWNKNKFYSDEIDKKSLRIFFTKTESKLPHSIKNLRNAIIQKSNYLSQNIESTGAISPNLGIIQFFSNYEASLMLELARAKKWRSVYQKNQLLNNLYNNFLKPVNILEGLVLKEIRETHIETIHKILNATKPPTKFLLYLKGELHKDKRWEKIAKASLVSELNFMRIASQEMRQQELSDWEPESIAVKFIRPNIFYKQAIEQIDFLVQNIDNPRAKRAIPSHKDFIEKSLENYFYFLNNRENLILYMIIPALDVASHKISQLSWQEDLLSLRIAAILYNRKYGKTPNKIEDLVPEFLKEVPQDIYSGEAVKYNPEQGFFYVIGPDLKDDNGKIGSDRQTQLNYKGDIVQHIFSPTKKPAN